MTQGKNPRNFSKKRQGKKKVGHPFAKKEWYEVRVPNYLNAKSTCGFMPVTKTMGTKIASEQLKGRIVETNMKDILLDKDQDLKGARKIKLVIEDVQGTNCITNFHGMDITRDALCSMIRKWQTLIEGRIDVQTSDDYLLRIFMICFTARTNEQLKATSYATNSQQKIIRKKMVNYIKDLVQKNPLKIVVEKLLSEEIQNGI